MTPPPGGVSQWEHVISWRTAPRRYARLRSFQMEGRETLDAWWCGTLRACPHDRLANCVAHDCSLCGVGGSGQGCLVCGTHVCDLCQSLPVPGWPHKRSGAQRRGQSRTTSDRGNSLLRDNLLKSVEILRPLNGVDLPLAVVSMWLLAHASSTEAVARLLLTSWVP